MRLIDGRDDPAAPLLVQALLQRAPPTVPLAPGQGRPIGRRRRQDGRRAPRELEIVRRELAATGEDEGALDDVLELAHVARPGVAREGGDGARVEAADVLAGGTRVLADEVLGEDGDVARA